MEQLNTNILIEGFEMIALILVVGLGALLLTGLRGVKELIRIRKALEQK
jgi:hypothetical protein